MRGCRKQQRIVGIVAGSCPWAGSGRLDRMGDFHPIGKT
jgi:hypothetical protein